MAVAHDTGSIELVISRGIWGIQPRKWLGGLDMVRWTTTVRRGLNLAQLDVAWARNGSP